MRASSVVQNFLVPNLRRKINKFNAHHDEKPKEPPIEWSSQPPAYHLKSTTSPSRTNPLISDIIGELNHHAIDNGDVKIPTSDFPVESNYESVTDPDTTPIKSIDYDEIDHLLKFFYSGHNDDILDANLQMLQVWLVVALTSKFYTLSTVLFHKDGGAKFSVTNYMSHFSMFVPTKSTVKLENENTGHAQGIGIILCRFTNCLIIYTVGIVYYCPGHPSNTLSLGALKFFICF